MKIVARFLFAAKNHVTRFSNGLTSCESHFAFTIKPTSLVDSRWRCGRFSRQERGFVPLGTTDDAQGSIHLVRQHCLRCGIKPHLLDYQVPGTVLKVALAVALGVILECALRDRFQFLAELRAFEIWTNVCHFFSLFKSCEVVANNGSILRPFRALVKERRPSFNSEVAPESPGCSVRHSLTLNHP